MPHCPSCGQPMSLADGAHLDKPYWTCDGPNDMTRKAGCHDTLPVRHGRLTRDITAEELALSASDWQPGDEGYAPDYVVASSGSTVRVIGDLDDSMIEVDEFNDDPFFAGFVNRSDLQLTED